MLWYSLRGTRVLAVKVPWFLGLSYVSLGKLGLIDGADPSHHRTAIETWFQCE
jgi:hypothetical protein